MRDRMFRNALTVGIILLFIGVSIQPAIAVNPIPFDNEEDCNICPKFSNLQVVRLKNFINRVERLDNKLSVMSKLNSKLAEKYQELSNKITTIKEMNKGLKSERDKPIICAILYILMLQFAFVGGIASLIEYRINPDSLFRYLLLPFIFIGEIGPTFWILLMVDFNCIEIYPIM